jgi:hypothetical protein
MKSEFGISSSFVGLGYGTTELCVKFCKALGLGSTILGSISDSVSSIVYRVFSKILLRTLLPLLAETCKNEPPDAMSRNCVVSLQRPI